MGLVSEVFDLLISGVDFAGKVLSAIISRPEQPKTPEPQKIESKEITTTTTFEKEIHHHHEPQVIEREIRTEPKIIEKEIHHKPTIIENSEPKIIEKEIHHEPITIYEPVKIVEKRVLDKKFLTDVVDKTVEKLSILLNKQTVQFFYILEEHQIRGAIQELQARVSALKTLVNYTTLDPNIATQIMVSSLNPLQVSLNIVEIRLKDAGQNELWEYCYVVGNSALLTGYAYLGQDLPALREELEDHLKIIQNKLINQVAREIIISGGEIPWNEVPSMLKPENAYKILDLNKSYQQSLQMPFDLNKMSYDRVKASLRKVKNISMLKRIYTEEEKNRKRVRVLKAIEQRKDELDK